MLMQLMRTDQGVDIARGRARAPGPALVPAASRAWVVTLICCCTALIATGGAIAAGQRHGNAVDRPVDGWLQSQFTLSHGALQVTAVAGLVILYVIGAALIGANLAAKRLNVAVLAVIAVPIASGITELILKPMVHETLSGGLMYPSGHTTNAFAIVAVIGIAAHLTPRSWLPRWLAALTVAVAIGAGCVVAVTMVSLGYHYFTDTLAGAAVGTSAVLAVALCLDAPAARARLGWPSRSAGHEGQAG
jgi:membrane-associated phospholipid phosphatase